MPMNSLSRTSDESASQYSSRYQSYGSVRAQSNYCPICGLDFLALGVMGDDHRPCENSNPQTPRRAFCCPACSLSRLFVYDFFRAYFSGVFCLIALFLGISPATKLQRLIIIASHHIKKWRGNAPASGGPGPCGQPELYNAQSIYTVSIANKMDLSIGKILRDLPEIL